MPQPIKIRTCWLQEFLTPQGGLKLKQEQDVAEVILLMEKIAHFIDNAYKCLSIMKATDEAKLIMFMDNGGWSLIYSWLLRATEMKKYNLMTEILNVILMWPVNIETVKTNYMPKLIKTMSKDTHLPIQIRKKASMIVECWLKALKKVIGTGTTQATLEIEIGANSTSPCVLVPRIHTVVE